jgi:hypothetical protein
MIWNEYIVFNEASIKDAQGKSLLHNGNVEQVLKDFFEICLLMYKLSGKEDANYQNLKAVVFVSPQGNVNHEFYWEKYLPDSNGLYFYLEKLVALEVTRDVIQTLLAEKAYIDSVPEYVINSVEVFGLGYAEAYNLIAISLGTNSFWQNKTLNINKIELGEKLEETQVIVPNVSQEAHAFELLEKYAKEVYAHTYHENLFFYEPSLEDKKRKQTQNFTHNLLPNKDISNEYVRFKGLYDSKDLDVTIKTKVAELVIAINGWEQCSKQGRKVYKHPHTNYYLGLDTEKGDFEIHNSKGEHEGAISFDCKKKEAPKGHKITPC